MKAVDPPQRGPCGHQHYLAVALGRLWTHLKGSLWSSAASVGRTRKAVDPPQRVRVVISGIFFHWSQQERLNFFVQLLEASVVFG